MLQKSLDSEDDFCSGCQNFNVTQNGSSQDYNDLDDCISLIYDIQNLSQKHTIITIHITNLTLIVKAISQLFNNYSLTEMSIGVAPKIHVLICLQVAFCHSWLH